MVSLKKSTKFQFFNIDKQINCLLLCRYSFASVAYWIKRFTALFPNETNKKNVRDLMPFQSTDIVFFSLCLLNTFFALKISINLNWFVPNFIFYQQHCKESINCFAKCQKVKEKEKKLLLFSNQSWIIIRYKISICHDAMNHVWFKYNIVNTSLLNYM